MMKKTPPGKQKAAHKKSCNKKDKVVRTVDKLILTLTEMGITGEMIERLEKFKADFEALELPDIPKDDDDEDKEDD